MYNNSKVSKPPVKILPDLNLRCEYKIALMCYDLTVYRKNKDSISMPDVLDILIREQCKIIEVPKLYWEQLKEPEDIDISNSIVHILFDYVKQVETIQEANHQFTQDELILLLKRGKECRASGIG